MSISERIGYIQQQEGISASKFADLLGVQRSGLSHIYAGRNKPSVDFLQKLSLQFPQYRLEWIINGNEPILKIQNKPQIDPQKYLFAQEHNNDVKSEENVSNEPIKAVNELEIEPKVDRDSEKEIVKKEIKEIMYIYSDNTFEIFKPVSNK